MKRYMATSKFHWRKGEDIDTVIRAVYEKAGYYSNEAKAWVLAEYETKCKPGDYDDKVYTDYYVPTIDEEDSDVSYNLRIIAADPDYFEYMPEGAENIEKYWNHKRKRSRKKVA